jgi:hypothetical protein
MDVVGLKEHGLTNLELDVVEEESNEKTNVVGELVLQSEHQVWEFLAVVWRAAITSELVTFVLCLLDEVFGVLLNLFGLVLHQTAESSLQSFFVLRSLGFVVCCFLALDRLLKFLCLVFSYQAPQTGYGVEEMWDLLKRAETTKAVEGRDGESHLGLVVVIRVVLGVFFVQLCGELLVGVGLDGQSLVDRQDLEQEGQLLLVLFRDLSGHQGLVVLEKVEQTALSLQILGGVARVCAHP